uniref:Xylulose kinase-1 n=1 Tax=Tanacetum cinerariifolium TaxID=118510 RepID=A0A699GVK5_TANCI|nr:hypothetical protein [Tanacetum cinerariifolium]
MLLTFADTHNMVAYLTKSDAREGFNQVIDFINGSYIKHALTINPHIYVSCIKQFWNTIVVKQSNDVTRLQALVDQKKVVIMEATIRDALRLEDAEGVDCLSNEEIFAELARMGYEKQSTKLTFYKAFFSSQWKRVGKGFSGVETPLFEGILVGVIEEQGAAEEQAQNDVDDAAAQGADTVAKKKVEEAIVAGDNQVRGRQAEIYQIDMDHALKVQSMQEDEPKVQEVVDVVTTAKLITEVVTTAIRVIAASTRRRKGVVIRDLEEVSTTIIPADTKSKDKGKGIMVEEPKPLKKKQQVKMDEEYARKLHEVLNKYIDWNAAIDYIKQKAKEDLFVQRYQVMKKRPQTEAQARRTMIMYLKNVDGFRLDYIKGMSYDDIRPIFEAKFNSNIEFLLKIKEQLE